MAAQIELVSLVSDCTSQATNIIIALQYRHFGAIDAQLVTGCESGRSRAQYYDMAWIIHDFVPVLRNATTPL